MAIKNLSAEKIIVTTLTTEEAPDYTMSILGSDVVRSTPITETSQLINNGETGDDRYIESWELKAGDKDTVLYNGDVVWLTGYQYYVWADHYKIDGREETTFISATITLDAADATLDRIDIFMIQDDGFGVDTIVKSTGTAAATPVKNTLDASLELEISIAFVTANTTSPVGVFEEIIYAED